MATSIFSGSSQFSTDFQSIITRTVAIASLPLRQKQSEVSALQAQSTELNTLGTAFTGLKTALTSLEAALGASSFGSASSDANVATVALTGTPLPGTFHLEVVDLGKYASSMSVNGLATVADPASANLSDATSFTLKIGDKSITITPTAATLTGLAEAINFNSEANVQATLVNVGSPSSPDYRLSLQGLKLGDQPISLKADNGSNPGQLLTSAQTTGAMAKYRVNGQPTVAISSDTREVTISPGVVATLYKEGSTDLTVSRSSTAANTALSRLASAYNAVQSAIDKNRGEGTGALRGQSILQTLSGGLHRIAEYAGGQGGMESLASIGLAFDHNGVLSFDSVKFSSATSGKISQLANFLGSPKTGGFLKAATDALNSLSGEQGALTRVTKSVQSQIQVGNESIAAEQDRIDRLQSQIEARMAAADAAIAALEQKYTYISSMFQAMNDANKNK